MTGRLEYKLDDESDWNSVEIKDTDPCKEYQVKIKINDNEETLPILENYKSNQASKNHRIEMANTEQYYKKNFKPKS